MKPLGVFAIATLIVVGMYVTTPSVYAALPASDLQKLQTESTRYQLTVPLFQKYIDGFLDGKIYTIDQLKTVADIDVKDETIMGGPDGTTPTQTTTYTVKSLKPSLTVPADSYIAQYKNQILPKNFNQYKEEEDSLPAENFAIKEFGTYFKEKEHLFQQGNLLLQG